MSVGADGCRDRVNTEHRVWELSEKVHIHVHDNVSKSYPENVKFTCVFYF